MGRSKRVSSIDKFGVVNSKQKIKNATTVTYKDGKKFRSKLEEFAYRKLIENGIINFNYESDKFILLEPFKYINESYEDGDLASNSIRAMTYTPDFVSINDNKEGWIMEIKGYGNEVFPLKWKFFKKYLIYNNYNITLFKPNNQGNVLKCIEIIKQKYYV